MSQRLAYVGASAPGWDTAAPLSWAVTATGGISGMRASSPCTPSVVDAARAPKAAAPGEARAETTLAITRGVTGGCDRWLWRCAPMHERQTRGGLSPRCPSSLVSGEVSIASSASKTRARQAL